MAGLDAATLLQIETRLSESRALSPKQCGRRQAEALAFLAIAKPDGAANDAAVTEIAREAIRAEQILYLVCRLCPRREACKYRLAGSTARTAPPQPALTVV